MRLITAVLAGLLLFRLPAVAQEDSPQEPAFTPQEIRAAKADPRFYTIDPKSVEVVNLGPAVAPLSQPAIPKPPAGGTTPPKPPVRPPGGQDPLVIIDRIINIAQKIWKIIEANKPVVDVTTTYANAVPKGVDHWTDLAGWKPPVGTVYGFYAKNMYGVKVIDVRYQVVRMHGGNYKGKGLYLNGVSFEPLKVSVSWGYKLTMTGTAPSVANVGTSEDPIASMVARLNWQIDTVVKHFQGTNIYYLQGDGLFKEMGGPFKNASREKTKKKIKSLSAANKLGSSMRIEGLKGRAAAAW